MSGLLGISLWIALATVVPGLVTLAVVYLCLAAAGIGLPPVSSDWIMGGIAVSVMVLTQGVGILLEELLTRVGWLGPRRQELWVPDPRRPGELIKLTIMPYEQYKGLYVVLARLREEEDAQGHLKRALAQFFLSLNTLVSFGTGVILAFVLAVSGREGLVYYGLAFLLALGISYLVTVIRFREMTRSLWAVQSIAPTRGGDTDVG